MLATSLRETVADIDMPNEHISAATLLPTVELRTTSRLPAGLNAVVCLETQTEPLSETVFVTDRQILERLLIPAMMSVVVLSMRAIMGDDGAVLDPVREHLASSMREAVADIAPDRVPKLMRRAKRITGEVVPVIKDKVVGVQYLALARLTADLADRDVITIGAESPFAKAWDYMAGVVELGWDQLQHQEDEVSAAAADMLSRLESQGVYS
ncbi:MAG: hypothetical protein WCJ64_04140 [Rhodospirillaceae bacterium]